MNTSTLAAEPCDAPLRDRLADPEERARAFAAEDAGFDDQPQDVEPLFDRLRVEPSRFVRDAIVTALCRMTMDGVAARAVELLQTEDAYLRSAGVTLLQSRRQDVILCLERAYPSADADVRKFLLDTASGITDERADRFLLLALGDEDVNVRIAAVEYLGERANPAFRGAFEALARTASEPMLISALLSALQPVGDASTWTFLDHKFMGPEGFPRFLAPQLLRLMAQWGPHECLDRFFDAPSRMGTASLAAWLDALEVFHDRFGFETLAADHVAVVRVVLDATRSPAIQSRLLRWMGRLKLEPGLASWLANYLDSMDPSVRQGAAAGLARLASPEARAILSGRLAAETDEQVRATMQGGLPAGLAVQP